MNGSAESIQPKSPASAVAAGALLILAGWAVYANSFRGPFVFLDLPAIADNPTIRHLWPLHGVLSPPTAGGVTVGGRPLVNLSLALNFAAGKLGVGGYHAVNLAIHLLAGLTLWGILRRTLVRQPAVAWVATLLWIVHPLQTESVTWIIQRAESLMGLFYLLTMYAVIRCADAAGKRAALGWGTAAFLACLCGMATKEVMVSAPVMAFGYDRTWIAGSFRAAWRRRWGLYSALASTWVLLAGLVIGTGGNRGGTSGFNNGFSWTRYALTQFPAIASYLRLIIWPYPQNFYPGARWVEHPVDIAAPAGLVLVLAGLTCWAVLRPGRRVAGEEDPSAGLRAWGYGGAWFFAILAPTSLVPGISQTMAEHRLYLASIPVLVLAVTALFWAAKRLVATAGTSGANSGLHFAVLLGLIWAAALGWLTMRRNGIYRSELSLWADTARQSPADPYVQNNYGVALVAADRPQEAAAAFTLALELNPNYDEPHNNLGQVLAQEGRFPEAIAQYRAALRRRPAYPEALANLGVALAATGKVPEAIAALEESVRLKPRNAEAQNNLAVVLAGSGRLAEAILHYRAFLALKPDSAEAHYNLGNALFTSGQAAQAVDEYQSAVRLKPNYPEAQANLGASLAAAGRLPEAVAQYQAALRLVPDDSDIHYNLGLALQALGRTADAQEQFRIARRSPPR